jgi:hypothetical protein
MSKKTSPEVGQLYCTLHPRSFVEQKVVLATPISPVELLYAVIGTRGVSTLFGHTSFYEADGNES